MRVIDGQNCELKETISDQSLTGEDLPRHLQRTVFDRLDMQKTGYSSAESIVPQRSTSYRKVGSEVKAHHFDFTPVIYASAGIRSTVEDMARWFEALLSGQFLAKEDLFEIWKPVSLTNGQDGSYGLGWYSIHGKDFDSAGHGGGNRTEVRHY